jgi:hypothetical protein
VDGLFKEKRNLTDYYPTEKQAIYEIMLKDDRLQCTCDESYREDSYFQATGHYHHCMLYQVTRAIELSLKYRDGFRLVNHRMILSPKVAQEKTT